MREYDDETLGHLQQCELMILDDFLHICDSEGLTYFGLAGTALGAVRHKGFIPWDDDIDVGLPSKDLERLIEVVKADYSDKYVIMNAAEDIHYPLPTTRMMLKGTQFCEEALQSVPCFMGIFLDLYAFDAVADDEKAYRKQAWDAWWWSHVRILLSIPKPVLPFGGGLKAVASKICQFASWFFNKVGMTSERAFKNEEAARNRYRDCETKRIAYLCDTDRFSQTIAWDDLLPLKKLEYEGRQIAFPSNYEQHLVDLYGDYMTLPPEEKRKNHFPARLDFGPY
ncbi:LicD family protein [Raoultibacter phocaeensis]|uniref:LicD family protein n=1 Tax=Raoultibacter phocaeensis TaxID=2479841 RepID=UPI00111A4EB4|nr:LicD family protein [Raoultibacter phocaeensis]